MAPNKGKYYLERGLIYSDMGEKKSAITDVSKAIEKNPKNYFALMYRGIMNLELGNVVKAKADFKKMERLGYTFESTGAYNIATDFANLGETKEACKWLDRTFTQNSDLIGKASTDPKGLSRNNFGIFTGKMRGKTRSYFRTTPKLIPIRETAEFKSLMLKFGVEL